MSALFQYPDTSWVKEGRAFFETAIPKGELYDDAVNVCVSIVNMQKASVDAFGERKCGNSVYMILIDMFRVLGHNKFWKIFGTEISARYANGLSRIREYGEMSAADYKMKGDLTDAEYMVSQFSWMDSIVFVAETMGHKDLPNFRADLRKLLYGV